MATVRLPAIRYDATSVRPAWADLPPDLRAAICGRLGSPVTWATSAGGGFTRGFAATLTTSAGERVFVKAASLVEQRHLSDWYAREAALTAELPAQVAAARPRWTLTTAGYFVLCLDAVDGRMPALPWAPAELDAALASWAGAARALRRPPAGLVNIGLPGLADLASADLAWWQEIAAGREAMPVFDTDTDGDGLLRRHLPELASLEADLPRLVSDDAVIHGDLRLDNLLIDRTGMAWICDWTWVCHGPAWFDTTSLLVTAYASGLDADALFARHPTAVDAPPGGLDAALAALSGYWLTRASAGPTGASPHVRAHQRFSGETALAWLAARRGWSGPFWPAHR
ncbi:MULTISPECIES: phosphotransferase [unclassified Solwaraspora]|uniref:phosphotransferase n=1 Tax=unclassified Solwaraspora TaxID=2627926 RepID=UPI00248CB3FE|nr:MULTISPECIES: phosphotransferase [unclassified Solwaraspora]WBB95417.1 phosphotransferase [Solwaraspora sp. WMMA2059]WBC20678.1 phosphotransferase [Solwaraspora sp. WMMA2080]WJK37189.1 phosphotransferase [Solwaraspora sp. WMMA2065]